MFLKYSYGKYKRLQLRKMLIYNSGTDPKTTIIHTEKLKTNSAQRQNTV